MDTIEIREQLMQLVEKGNKPKSKVWAPKDGEMYHFLQSDGYIDVKAYRKDNVYDNKRFNLGNYFKTYEEAEFARERLKVIAELKRFAIDNNEAELNWHDSSQTKWCIGYNYLKNRIEFKLLYRYQTNNIYFSSAEVAQKAIDTIGEDRIKKYYVGITDERN